MICNGGLVTAEQLLELSTQGRFELVAGELRNMSPAGNEHGYIASRILIRLGLHVEQNRLGRTYAAETGFRIATDPDTVRAPDAAFVSNQSLAGLVQSAGYLNLAPDLVVEVVSPHDLVSEVEQKVASWLNAGSKVVLVADPRALTIRVYRQAEPIQTLRSNDSFEGGTVVPGWKLSVREAFGLS